MENIETKMNLNRVWTHEDMAVFQYITKKAFKKSLDGAIQLVTEGKVSDIVRDALDMENSEKGMDIATQCLRNVFSTVLETEENGIHIGRCLFDVMRIDGCNGCLGDEADETGQEEELYYYLEYGDSLNENILSNDDNAAGGQVMELLKSKLKE